MDRKKLDKLAAEAAYLQAEARATSGSSNDLMARRDRIMDVLVNEHPAISQQMIRPFGFEMVILFVDTTLGHQFIFPMPGRDILYLGIYEAFPREVDHTQNARDLWLSYYSKED
jgi:hypothetical protein